MDVLDRDKITVAIIGGYDDGIEDVSDYDVVARTNNHWLRQGGRIDALWHCGGPLPHVNPDKLIENETFRETCKLVGTPDYPCHSSTWREYCHEHGVELVFHPPHKGFREELDRYLMDHGVGQPLTGIIAMAYYLSRDDVSEVFLTGQNLYHHEPDRDSCVIAHNPFWHAMFIRSKMLTDSRLNVDRTMAGALQSFVDSAFPLA